MKKGEKKSRIVAAAIKCFVEHGVAGTAMSQVAQKAKVDQPLIHYYFPTTESLYQDVFKVVLESLKEASVKSISASHRSPAKALAAYVRVPFLWAQSEPGLFSIWMYFYYLASFQPAFYRLNAEIRQAGRERIAVLIYGGIEEGVFRLPAGTTVKEMALNIQGLITGNTIMFGTEGTRDRAFIEATVAGALRWLGVSRVDP